MKVVLTAVLDDKDVATFAACAAKIGRFPCYTSTIENVSRETLEEVFAQHADALCAPSVVEKAA